jgi:mg2 transporter protein corA family protein
MYDTVPLGIFLTPDFFITVCLEESEVLYPFISNQLSTFYTYKKTRFLFQILYRTATLFLRYLQQINRRTDDIEVQLRHTTKNKDFFQLLELQKSMTYFTSALRTNGTVMERLLRLRGHSTYRHLLKMYEEDEDLLEDVIIENKQAIEMVEMYSNILMNMMNAFTSIISNNLNMVMKMLAALTITLAVPTIIFSLWGTNVALPFQDDPNGFYEVVGISVVCSIIAIIGMWKKDLF